jgi:hypothetical protein
MEFKVASAESLSDESRELPVLYLILNDFHKDVVVKAIKAFRDIPQRGPRGGPEGGGEVK